MFTTEDVVIDYVSNMRLPVHKKSKAREEVPGLIPSHSEHTQGLQQSEVSQNWCFLSSTMSPTQV